MIYINQRAIGARHYNNKAIVYIYKGARLVWQAISSCFGAGYWINTYGWKNTDGWKNNK